MSAPNDVVSDGGARHLDVNPSVREPFTEAYFEDAAATLATKPSSAGTPLSELLLRHCGVTGAISVLSSQVECTAEVKLLTGDQLILKTSTRPEGRDSFRFYPGSCRWSALLQDSGQRLLGTSCPTLALCPDQSPPTSTLEPSKKRDSRKCVGSTQGLSFATRSAARRPMPGPMPKPWPEPPAAK
ncbi:hypothetical protein ACVIKP_006583 [Rhizobium leguminosarum]